MKTPSRAQCVVYRVLEADDFPDDASLERYVKETPTPPPSDLLQSVINQKELHFGRDFKAASVHTNPQGETFCFGQFGSGKNSLVITLLWFNPRNGKWRYHGVSEALTDKEAKRYLSGVKPRPGLKRYSNAQLRRFLARRQPEPHWLVREALDPDDPEVFVQSQPGFQFRHTTYDGDQVLLRGDSDVGTESDWPWPIGHVVQGPNNRWYVIDIHRIAQERLDDFGLGFKARTFDTKEDAALAIWRVWSQLPKRDVLDSKRRRIKEGSEEVVSRLLEDAVRPSASIEKDLIKAARKIKHSGDYGTLYYHPGEHAVHWTMADSDGDPMYTEEKEIKSILALPGITHVELGDEWSPDEDEGWKRLI